MIISDNGMVRLKGSPQEILADLTAAVHSEHEALAEKLGEEKAKKFIDEAVKDAFKSPEELEAEIHDLLEEKEQILHEAMKDIANILFRGGM